MSISFESLPEPPRVADPGDGISIEELQLAARNHAMPMEAMRHDVTPPGLHYVLNHFDIPGIDPVSWRLVIDGLVERPVALDLDLLTAMPRHTVRVTMECAGNGRTGMTPRPISQPWLNGAVGTADWTGVRLADLLEDAGVTDDAVDVVFTGADHGVQGRDEHDYARGLSLEEALGQDVLVAYEMNHQPLPPQHGFPVRLVVPGWYGMTHVKWLTRITVVDEPFEGYQNLIAYRYRQDPDELGEPVTRMEPRALLVPPGFPDFMSRTRLLRPGPVVLEGRAWSGWGTVNRVELSTDDGKTWSDAVLDEAPGRWAWRRFSAAWDAVEGEHRLMVRAHDSTGRVQPAEPGWNLGGFSNNSHEPIVVLVGSF